jgi:hypothetical protein
LLECGVKKPLSMMMKLKHIMHVLFTKASQITLVATFYVCVCLAMSNWVPCFIEQITVLLCVCAY